MTLTCSSYSTSVLPTGRLQLVLNEAQQDPVEERVFIPEIAKWLKCSDDTVARYSNLPRNPLPLVRGKGRPYGFRSSIQAWLDSRHTDRTVSANKRKALKVFGTKV